MAQFELTLASLSDTGLKRENNEDSIGVNGDCNIAILADGMGGYMAGEIASAIAVTTTQEHLELACEKGLDRPQAQPVNVLLNNAVEMANHAIFTAAQSNPLYKNMGTTLVAMMLFGDVIHYAHVGDSRLYRLREEQFEQLTKDHSLVNELLDQGFYTEEQAASATNRNVITRAMGIKPEVEADVGCTAVRENDVFLLCSDGLSDLVTNEEIGELVSKNRDSLHNCCQELIDIANQRGGKDNISVIVAEVHTADDPSKSTVASVVDWLFKH